MEKKGAVKWLVIAIKYHSKKGKRTIMPRKKVGYALILQIITMLREKGISDNAIKNILDAYS